MLDGDNAPIEAFEKHGEVGTIMVTSLVMVIKGVKQCRNFQQHLGDHYL